MILYGTAIIIFVFHQPIYGYLAIKHGWEIRELNGDVPLPCLILWTNELRYGCSNILTRKQEEQEFHIQSLDCTNQFMGFNQQTGIYKGQFNEAIHGDLNVGWTTEQWIFTANKHTQLAENKVWPSIQSPVPSPARNKLKFIAILHDLQCQNDQSSLLVYASIASYYLTASNLDLSRIFSGWRCPSCRRMKNPRSNSLEALRGIFRWTSGEPKMVLVP